MVRDRAEASFGDEIGDGHPQGDVHRNRDGVFNDENLDVKIPHERVELILQVVGNRADQTGDVGGAGGGTIGVAIDVGDTLFTEPRPAEPAC